MSGHTHSRCKKNNSFTEHVHQIREHELVTSVEDYNVLVLTSCRFVDCHVNGWR